MDTRERIQSDKISAAFIDQCLAHGMDYVDVIESLTYVYYTGRYESIETVKEVVSGLVEEVED